jgi:predicted ester cyclase
MFHAVPDSLFSIKDQIVEGDRVITRWTAYGTHIGVFYDLQPTRSLVSIAGIDILRIANTKIIEGWMVEEMRRE